MTSLTCGQSLSNDPILPDGKVFTDSCGFAWNIFDSGVSTCYCSDHRLEAETFCQYLDQKAPSSIPDSDVVQLWCDQPLLGLNKARTSLVTPLFSARCVFAKGLLSKQQYG